MTIKQFIAKLKEFPPNMKVIVRIEEPYQDDAATLEEHYFNCYEEDGKLYIGH